MSRTEHAMPVRLVAGSADSQATKVRAYWGKTIPAVQQTPHVPVWHRLGWNSKYIHTHDTPDRAPTCSHCTAEHHDRGHSCQQRTYSRHHTHTHSHSQSQRGTHRLVLQQSWVPGMNGAPPTQENHSAWCGELDGQLMHIHNTLDSIQRRSAQRSQQHRLEQEQMHTADIDTIRLRAKVNASVASQMEFFTAIQSAWCRPAEATHI